MFCAYTRPKYQVSVNRTIGPLVFIKKVEVLSYHLKFLNYGYLKYRN